MAEGNGDADKPATVDHIFHVGDDNYKLIIKVNKDILTAKSSVFEKLLNNSFSQQSATEITDVNPEAFIIMLKYLRDEPYCFSSKELAVDVMHAAEKYELLKLKLSCENFLLPRTVMDVWWVASHAYRYNSKVLQRAIRELLSKHTAAFLFDENFMEASEEFILDVVQLDSVADVSELEIFKVVVEWAKHQFTKEGVTSYNGKMLWQKLQKFLKYLRLGVISLEDRFALPQFLNSKKITEILEICSGEKDGHEEDDGCEDESESERKLTVTLCVDEGIVPSEQLPRNSTPVTTGNEQHRLVKVTMCKTADVSLCYRKKMLQESVSLVQKADLVSVVMPSKLYSGDAHSSHYVEDIQVSVTCVGYNKISHAYCLPKIYGSGSFKGVVNYGQEIHIPITRSGVISNLPVSSSHPLTYTFKVYFKGQGLYPWQAARTFPSDSLLGSSSTASAGCITGYRFRPY